MTLEQQVNVQELQRLNDAITLTMDAIRRVAPQIALLQQAQQQQAFAPQAFPFTGPPTLGIPGIGYGAQVGFGQPWVTPQTLGMMGQPLGTLGMIDPIMAAYVQGHIHALKTMAAPHLGVPGLAPTLGVPPVWPQPSFGLPWTQQAYGQLPYGQLPFAQPQSPFVNVQQAPYGVPFGQAAFRA